MHNIKQETMDAISKLPENANIEDIMYRLYVIDKINRGQEAVENGETLTIDQLKREMETW